MLHVLVVPDRRYRVPAVRARVVVVGPDRFTFGGLHPRPVPGRSVVLATVHLRLDDVLFQLVDDVLQQFTPDVLRVLRNYHSSRHVFKEEEIKTLYNERSKKMYILLYHYNNNITIKMIINNIDRLQLLVVCLKIVYYI